MNLARLCALFSLAISIGAQTQDHCTVAVSKKITIKAPTVFTGTLRDDTNIPFVGKSIVFTSLDPDKGKTVPDVSQSAVTDSQGAFHFDSVPAGKYALTIDLKDWAIKKVEIRCAVSNSCQVALVVRPASPHDCYSPNYHEEKSRIHGPG